MCTVLVLEMSFLCSVIEDSLSEVVDIGRFILTRLIDWFDFDELTVRVLPLVLLYGAPCMHLFYTIYGHDVEDVE